MVVQVGGSFAYLPGDGMLTFEDHVRTVGDLRAAIEEKTQIPATKQASKVLYPSFLSRLLYFERFRIGKIDLMSFIRREAEL